MPKIIFLVQQLSQPRCIKRISAIYNAGYNVEVYGFDSGLYNKSLDNMPFPVKEIIVRSKNDSNFKKIKLFAKTIRRVQIEKSEDDIVYLFGFEFGSIAYILGLKKYIYEEADISASRIKSTLLRNVLLTIDRRVICNSMITILTSSGFKKYLFKKQIVDNILLLPNKLSPYFDGKRELSTSFQQLDYENIKFGFIGLIRYPNTLMRFAKVVGKYFPQHQFHFFGDIERSEYADEEVRSYSNVFFNGPFVSPSDLHTIYSAIDISVVCYDTSSINVRVLEPNKLYESIFFSKPIVVSKSTFLEERVLELGVGFSIDSTLDSEIIKFINTLSKRKLQECVINCQKIETKELIDDPTILINRLTAINK